MSFPYFSTSGSHGFSVQAHDAEAQPLALSHRGFATDGDENSAAAFLRSVELGYGWLETDVRTSRDGVVMVFHDRMLDRVTDASGPLADRTRDELRSVLIGGREPIPTLEEVLLRWPHLRFNVDVKDDASVEAFADVVNRCGAHDRVLVASFSDLRRRKVLRLLTRRTASSAGALVNLLIRVLGPFGLTRAIARAARVDAVQVPLRYRGIPVATAGYIRRCRAASLEVHVWTINDEPTMTRLLDLGVGGIVSDRADLLAGVMKQRGFWPQGRPAAPEERWNRSDKP
ncbi:glycerophosphodiester phosphodiesterase family protein [Arthrobacter sp. Br18]|uniref:glycerophosphodiester phosphodiesterase family protein n=1 Tax=Arthrobacter sp. Br18 TaxID=1312954 RepID=UPI0004B58F5C|nr:glycerophosphodiester phosphodiesterase family protein [Arthrobacter sp. Br18]